MVPILKLEFYNFFLTIIHLKIKWKSNPFYNKMKIQVLFRYRRKPSPPPHKKKAVLCLFQISRRFPALDDLGAGMCSEFMPWPSTVWSATVKWPASSCCRRGGGQEGGNALVRPVSKFHYSSYQKASISNLVNGY